MTPRIFPLILSPKQRKAGCPTHIPWEMAERAYSVYSARFGTAQSLEHLAERGGFGPDVLVPGWRPES